MQKESELYHQRQAGVPGKAVPTPVGSMNFNVLRALLEEGMLLRLGQGAEVGVFEAQTSTHLLRSFPELKLVCVDPWLDYSKYEVSRTQQAMSEAEERARQRLMLYESRVTIIKDQSVNAAKNIPDESLDFVFIDALHTYDAVLEDLKAWYPKVRPDGLISGHDYSWDGVQQALEDFISPLNKSAFHTPPTSDVWFFVK